MAGAATNLPALRFEVTMGVTVRSVNAMPESAVAVEAEVVSA